MEWAIHRSQPWVFLDDPIDCLLLLLLFRVKVQTQFLPLQSVSERDGVVGNWGFVCFCFCCLRLSPSTYIHTQSHKSPLNFAICNAIDGREGHYASERSQAEKDKNIVWYHLYVESKKFNKLVNIATTKKQQIHIDIELVATSRGREGQYKGRGLKGANC